MNWRMLGLAALTVVALTGCTGGDSGANSTESKTSSGAGGEFKVALLTVGPVSDAGWNAMAYDALQGIKSEMNATVDNQEAPPSKAKDAMRAYAQKGYQLVFGHGFEYNEPGAAVAGDFPDTVFISSSGGKTAPNAGAFRFYLEQGFYLAGMMAGKMSKTGKIGSVAVLNIPSINSTIKAYEAGAKAANPNIKIIPTVYFGTEGDIAGAKRATESILGQGADFVIHQANSAAKGVFDACAEKKANAFGSNLNQNDQAGVIGSAIINAKPAFLDLAKRVQAKEFKGEIVLVGMDKDAIDFVINPARESEIPADVKQVVDDTRKKIRAGELTVPKDEF
ncbi:MAG: BMP family protein [Fimbriimonadaceae bacterium]|nr:BMP family protein [Fimbriimonadaceae bacterium]